MRRDYSEFERVVLNMLARQNNAMTVLLARDHNDKTEELTGHVVLVVEDDDDVQRAIRQLLRNAGANVFYERTALKAQERMDQVGAGVFTCAVLDVRLPDSEGTDLANDVRRAAPNCGIVLTSGYPLDEFEEESQRHAFALLEKPFESRALIDAVLAAIQLRAPKPSLEERLDARLQTP
jgi:DNA-binding NtrC family response regulator